MKKQVIIYVAITVFMFCALVKSQAQNTFPATGSVGIGTASPQAYLHVVGANDGTGTTLFEATEANTSLGDYFKIVNGTGNTTTFEPVLWGHNNYTNPGNNVNVLPSLSLIGSTTSAADVTSQYALISLNARQLSGSSILNRNILSVSNYTTPLFTIGSTGNINSYGSFQSTNNIISQLGNFQWGNSSQLNPDQGGAMELGGNNTIAGLGASYIDFHYNGKVQDYNMRLVNSDNGVLQLEGGSLLIGTSCNPSDAKLAVNGKIYATAVTVILPDAQGCFPDYVFEKDYKLMPLSEVEKYIKANKHLPEVPTAAQVEKDGIDMAGMNTILLKKIEELTLHMIEMKRESEILSKEIQILKKK